jgi:hypothetical protein
MKAVCLDYDADKITPSPVVDQLWRSLLLFPVLYTTVCHGILQDTRLFDYNPNTALDDTQENAVKSKQTYQTSLNLYKTVFACDATTEIWPLLDINSLSTFAAGSSDSFNRSNSSGGNSSSSSSSSNMKGSDINGGGGSGGVIGRKSERRDDNEEIGEKDYGAHTHTIKKTALSSEKHDQSNDIITIILRDSGGDMISYKLMKTMKMDKVFEDYAKRKGIDVKKLRFCCNGGIIRTRDTPYKLKIEDGDEIYVTLEQVGMIGIFTSSEDSLLSQLLDKTDVFSTIEVADVISSLKASPHARFTFIPPNESYRNAVMGPKEQALLRDLVDKEWSMSRNKTQNENESSSVHLEDFKLFLSMWEIKNILGSTKVKELSDIFAQSRAPFSNSNTSTTLNNHNGNQEKSRNKDSSSSSTNKWDQIIIRRCTSYGKRINMHVDKSLQTMQVALNDDTSYEGGRLVFACEGKIVTPQRLAGCITVHDNSIAHGVTELKAGVRYGLFFIKN